jgi:hypothetical protein
MQDHPLPGIYMGPIKLEALPEISHLVIQTMGLKDWMQGFNLVPVTGLSLNKEP